MFLTLLAQCKLTFRKEVTSPLQQRMLRHVVYFIIIRGGPIHSRTVVEGLHCGYCSYKMIGCAIHRRLYYYYILLTFVIIARDFRRRD